MMKNSNYFKNQMRQTVYSKQSIKDGFWGIHGNRQYKNVRFRHYNQNS